MAGALPNSTFGQTPAQMEYDRQQREYRQQQEQQRQEQQRQQQLMNDNARRSQDELNRSTGVPLGGQGGAAASSQSRSAGAGGAQGGAQASAAARAAWQKRPPLPVEQNPLLGRWTRPASARPNPSDPFSQLQALAKGGLCEVLFGGGVFEFRPNALFGMDQRTREQELDRVEYRGDSKHVVVVPKTTLNLMEFDVEGPNRVNWASQKCVLVRVGAAPGAKTPNSR
jgi:hypothetical protein